MNMTCTCGCCEGIAITVPQSTANRPGLPALACRVGTHATFLETMIARLSSHDYPALAALTTRDPADPSIALLDSWALVGDVLSFYQERIANEGYLRTATERRSILELARLIGYKLRPGVASTVYLAYTLAEDLSKTPPAPTTTVIPAGSRSQSIPGPGQLPQSFETSDDLVARSAWNNLQPRLKRPQLITVNADFGTDAATRDTVYFSGLATNLKSGDALLLVLDEKIVSNATQQVLRIVNAVTAQDSEKRTEVVLQPDSTPIHDLAKAETLLTAIYTDATTLFAGSNISSQIAALLRRPADSPPDAPLGLLDVVDNEPNITFEQLMDLVRRIIPSFEQLHDLALKRNFTRLEPWLAQRFKDLNDLIQKADGYGQAIPGSGESRSPTGALQPSPLGNLGAILSPLSRPPSLQPLGSLRLARSVARTFSPESDLAPKLLATFKPAAAPLIYGAWENLDTPGSQVSAFAFRAKAALFASSFIGAASSNVAFAPNAPGTVATTKTAYITSTDFSPPILDSAWDGTLLSLDATNEKILAGSWVAIQFPNLDADGNPDATQPVALSYHRVDSVQTAAVTAITQDAAATKKTGGLTAKVTRLKLNPSWSPPAPANATPKNPNWSTDVLRQTVVHVQAEPLDLAEEPLDIDIEGDTIELDGVYDGLESGRWIIVSGERTDIPNVTGVKASELVMIAGVEQGLRTASCAQWPADLFPNPPFTGEGYYVTPSNKFGDRLVIGRLAQNLPDSFTTSPTFPNQQYCGQVELAPGLRVNAYVPASRELKLDFTDFDGLLVNPLTGESIPSISPLSDARVLKALNWGRYKGNFWGWRISAAKVHTLLTLANKLAYTYDLESVVIYGNVAKATHGETRTEVLGNGDSSQAFQQFALKQKPLTFVPASNPSGTDSTLKLYVNNVEWHETDTLAGLGAKDRDFVTRTADDDTTSVIFGNGRQGARLPTGSSNVMAIYRYGIGQPGNVDANQISLLQSKPLNVKAVINPLRASGGADRDSRDQARRNAPLAVMALDRLVSVQDYADFARTFAGIGKASSARLSNGRRELVHVTIAGAEDIPIAYTSDLYANLVQALKINGDPYEPLQVVLRRLRLLVISANVKILPDYLWEPVVADIRSALENSFSFDNRDLGQPVFQSEVISAIQGVTGVAYVDLQIMDSVAEDVTVAELAALAAQLKLNDFIEAELARPNPTPVNYPDDSILPAELVYLSSALPETLILNEVKS